MNRFKKLKQFLNKEVNDDDNNSTCAENIMKTVCVVSNLNKIGIVEVENYLIFFPDNYLNLIKVLTFSHIFNILPYVRRMNRT